VPSSDGIGQFFQQDVGLAIEHLVALQDGGLADGLGQVAFAGAAWAEKQRVFAAIDEGAGGQIEDQAAVHLGVEGEVEVVEGLVGIAEAGVFAAPFQQRSARRVSSSETRWKADRWAPWVRLAPDAGGFRARRPCRRGGVGAARVGVR
jgi:hypothetical protein